ncbi:hypothetical protein P3X46_002444 [Hevea brasiliensis]|uniref:FBD domain-containing protein n=1 Tax=Hevea brasiliensis TaxID=3981 RepID=A0ABQ9N5H6_HEVBR|nr:hypothetical protein P3X46_002444 [Hevea brasiliensis]
MTEKLVFNSFDHQRHFESLSLVSNLFLSITNQLHRTLTIFSQVVPLLPRLLERFPNLKVIEIQEFEGDLNSLLYLISKSGLDLKTPGFLSQSHFPLVSLRELGLRMRNLRKLNCSKLSHFKDSDLFVIGTCFPLLEDLDISYPQYNSCFNPNGSLDLQSFFGVVTDEGIVDLALNFNKLLVMCNSANLNSISLDGVGIPSIDSFFIESFTYAKTLCHLHLSNSFISDELLYSVDFY